MRKIPDIPRGNAPPPLMLGDGRRAQGGALRKLGRWDEAVAADDEVIRRFGDDADPELREQVAKALISQGGALHRLGRHDEAVAVLDEVIQRFGDSE